MGGWRWVICHLRAQLRSREENVAILEGDLLDVRPLGAFAAGGADWPTFNGGPAATGYTAEVVTPPLELQWQFKARGGFYFPPAVAQGRVIVGCLDYNVYALDAARGNLTWTFHTEGPVYSGATVAEGVVYIGSADRNLYALDLQRGKRRWQYTADGAIYCPPLVYQGLVVVGTLDSPTLHAVDARTGQRRWRFLMADRMGSALAAGEGLIFVGSYDQTLYALAPKTGELRWWFAAPTNVDSCPAVAEGVVYIKTYQDDVFALEAQTGAEKWHSAPPQPPAGWNWSALAVAHGLVYFASTEGHRLCALDAATGVLEWAYETEDEVVSSPAIAGPVAYVGTKENRLLALDARTGELRWEQALDLPAGQEFLRGIMWAPAVAEGTLYLSSLNGVVAAFRPRT
ncbi:MAG TPA: hypothetical protein EYP85_01625 [Armatimonadetes bacterium]|nr:hypothetical protein [Armatimonadota bacterium]